MKNFASHRGGATAIEYALIASLIGFLLIGALTSIGGSVSAPLATLAAIF